MDFTNFDQMNQMITAASGMLSQTLCWVLGGLVFGLIACSIGGALGQGWREARQPRRRPQSQRQVIAYRSTTAQKALRPSVCA